jgi:hypothetical protein
MKRSPNRNADGPKASGPTQCLDASSVWCKPQTQRPTSAAGSNSSASSSSSVWTRYIDSRLKQFEASGER